MNRVEYARECFAAKTSIDEINTKLIKHQKTEKVYENGLTNNSKLKVIINSIHPSLLEKNYVINIAIIGEGTYKEIQMLEENINKKFKMYFLLIMFEL